MKDFRTVVFYKSEDAMDGIDFDNPHQYDTDEGYFIGLAHDIVGGEQRTFAVIENPETKDIFYIDFKLLKAFKDWLLNYKDRLGKTVYIIPLYPSLSFLYYLYIS